MWGTSEAEPISKYIAHTYLNDAIERTGISIQRRSFQSLRHTCVSLMRPKVGDSLRVLVDLPLRGALFNDN